MLFLLLVLNVCMSFWHQAFVSAQNQLTQPFLECCEVRDQFKERMTELYDYPKYSCPFKRGSRWGEWTLSCMVMVLQRFVPLCWRSSNKASLPFRYFHFYNTGLQNQSVMYVQESLDAEPRAFLDPNTFSDDGTVALRGVWDFSSWIFYISGNSHVSEWYILLFCTFAFSVLFCFMPFFCCYGNIKAMHSLRMASTWRMVPVPAAQTG